jgi:hypothetical protein
MTVPVLVWEEIGMGVSVTAGKVVGMASVQRIWFTKELPTTMATPANNTSARERASHCFPAVILAWRVR